MIINIFYKLIDSHFYSILEKNYTRYSIESIHCHMMFYMYLLQNFCCAFCKEPQFHVIVPITLQLVTTCDRCHIPHNRFQPIYSNNGKYHLAVTLSSKRQSVPNISWFNYKWDNSSIHSSWVTFMPGHINFTSWIPVLVLCLNLYIDDFVLLELLDLSCIRNCTVSMDH